MISNEELKGRLNRYELKYSKLKNMFKENEKIRKEFMDRFPINSLKTLTKEAYSIGEAYQDSFYYWLERKTEELGNICGTTVNKFGLWYSTKDKEYRTTMEFGNCHQLSRLLFSSISLSQIRCFCNYLRNCILIFFLVPLTLIR